MPFPCLCVPRILRLNAVGGSVSGPPRGDATSNRVQMPLQSAANRFLFNFAASYTGGGYKRLQAYAAWFARNGGAWFVIHPQCLPLRERFPENRYFVVDRSRLRRIFDDWSYLKDIRAVTGQPDLYYAYGIPLYGRFGRVNWSHLNNILTVDARGIPLSVAWRAKFRFLGWRLRRGCHHAQVVSAESRYSLERLRAWGIRQAFLSVNGSDDELSALRTGVRVPAEELAVVVGTYTYRALDESLRVFEMLRRREPDLRLAMIGDCSAVASRIARHPAVLLLGSLERREVVECLRRARYFINTSYAENSYNCVAEGIFLAQRSFIAPIAPHHELLSGETFRTISLPGLARPLLYTERAWLRGINLQDWNHVIEAMLRRTWEELSHRSFHSDCNDVFMIEDPRMEHSAVGSSGSAPYRDND